jgi:hypothetical protein
LTVWIALTKTNEANGFMLTGSYQGGIAQHRDIYEPNNILTRGQSINAKTDKSRAV